MRRFSAAFAFLFVASLVLASYGHCRPMLATQMQQAASHSSEHHHAPQPQHHHPTEGFGQELSVAGVPTVPVGAVQPPLTESFAPMVLFIAIVEQAPVPGSLRPCHHARAGPSAFEQFHARTGRLLI